MLKFRYTTAVPKQESLQILRSMKRKINLVSSNKSQKGINTGHKDNRESYEVWLEKKRRDSSRKSDVDFTEISETDSSDDEANTQAFKEWIEDKKKNKVKPLNVTRPVHNVIRLGSTEPGEPKPQEPMFNLTAYKDWLVKRKQKGANSYRMKTVQDFMSQRRKLEEKRQKLLLSVISYDDWADFDQDKQAVIREIMKADLEELKCLEEENTRRRTPSQITHEEWRENAKRRQEMEKHKKEMDKKIAEQENNYWRKEILTTSAALPHSEWLRAKNIQTTGKCEQNKENRDIENRLRQGNEKAFETWVKNKHNQEIKDLQNSILRERNIINTLEKTPKIH